MGIIMNLDEANSCKPNTITNQYRFFFIYPNPRLYKFDLVVFRCCCDWLKMLFASIKKLVSFNNLRALLLITIFCIVSNTSILYGQGIVRGKITDDKGEEIVGATIVLKSTPSIGAITDLNGNFSLRINDSSPQTISISYISYNTLEDIVNPKNGEVIIRNYTMFLASYSLEGVVVNARAVRENESFMQIKRINSPTTLDYISRETIRKTGDSHIDDAVKRVTGVSTVGGYITVRGLADRYIKTTINGARIPTLDPLTNNIKLDMFPTSLIDNIVINKATTPDLPGDWAGSYLSIETKDYPEKLLVSIKTTFGYNQQSSFTDVLSTQRGPTDWLGFDNGFRDIKHYEKGNFPFYVQFTNPYDEFVVLGLSEFMNNNGITQENFPSPSSSFRYYAINNMYYRMALVKLGLLPPGLIYDTKAVQTAIDAYYNNPDLKDKAHAILNAEAISFSHSMPINWMTSTRRTSLDYSQDISIGNQVTLFGRPLGFIAVIRYSSGTRYDPNNHKIIGIFSQNPANLGKFEESISLTRKRSVETNQWSALLNAAYQINKNNSFSLMVMPNFTGMNNAAVDSGSNFLNKDLDYEFIHRQLYEERKQIIYQWQSSHFLPKTGIKLEFNASFTDGQSNTPDFKNFDFGVEEGTGLYKFKQTDKPNRLFRYLNEDIFDTRVSMEFPLFEKPGKPRKIKLGAAFLNNTLSNRQYNYLVYGDFSNQLRFNSQQSLFDYINIEKFSTISENKLSQFYLPHFRASDFNKGESRVISGFIMTDFTLHPKIRMAGGLRVEQTDVYTDVLDMFGRNIPPFHSDRLVSLPGFSKLTYANPSSFTEVNYLPSVNFVYKWLENEKTGVNIRLGYSNTIGRPTLREVSSYFDYNYTIGNFVMGNTELKMVHINNLDVRLESYFKSGDNFSISFFRKHFENHIELGNENNVYTWRNAPGVTKAIGFELEGKKKLLKNFEVMGNVAFVQSRAIAMLAINGIITDTIVRNMYGQAPYIINAICTYSSNKLGIAATLSYNIQGPKLAFVTITEEQPDVYELPRHMLDLKVSKSIGKNFGIEFRIRDLLNTRHRWAYDHDDFKIEYEGYRYGTNYSLSFSYNL